MGEAESQRVIVVAGQLEKAQGLALGLARAGFAASASTDIGGALDENPAVLVLFPTGWESTAKAILGGYDSREPPPPAVILVGEDDNLPYLVGPSLFYFREPVDIPELSTAIRIGFRRREYFAYHWPRMLNFRSTAGVKEVERILAERTGITVREDWLSSFSRAVQERMVANLLPTVSDYERLLTEDQDEREVHLLACRVAVGETHFWRYSGQMNALKTLLARVSATSIVSRKIKIWSAGCSTGEEPYSIAMAAVEALGDGARVEVFGTDINTLSLAFARVGAYTERSLRNLPPRLLTRFFDEGGRMRPVTADIKKRVTFTRLNLCLPEAAAWAKEHGPFDAVFCRNVTIYFSAEVARRVVSVCADSLKVGGGLFLGSSETLHPLLPGLTLVQAPGAFYYLKGDAGPQEPVKSEPPPVETPSPIPVKRLSISDRRAIFERGLEAVSRENFSEARAAFDELVSNDPGCPLGNTGIALVFANQGRETEARAVLKKVIYRRDEPAEANFVLGLLDERAGAPEAALAHYARAVRIDPDFFMAHVNSAWILKREGKTDLFREEMRKALATLRRSVPISPWVTGGLGLEAILSLVIEASEEGEG